MSTYRVPKCGRHFVKFDDVTLYPVLVVARTAQLLPLFLFCIISIYINNFLLYFATEYTIESKNFYSYATVLKR